VWSARKSSSWASPESACSVWNSNQKASSAPYGRFAGKAACLGDEERLGDDRRVSRQIEHRFLLLVRDERRGEVGALVDVVVELAGNVERVGPRLVDAEPLHPTLMADRAREEVDARLQGHDVGIRRPAEGRLRAEIGGDAYVIRQVRRAGFCSRLTQAALDVRVPPPQVVRTGDVVGAEPGVD
jgi:hypothetical protein